MKKFVAVISVALTAAGIGQVALADDDFHGILESRPEGKVGTWVVGGRSVEVTERTDLDEDNGPLNIGACVEVDVDGGAVEEIESEPAKKCDR